MTQKTTKQPECCGKKAKFSKTPTGDMKFTCEACGKFGSGKTSAEAAKNFNKETEQKNIINDDNMPAIVNNFLSRTKTNIKEIIESRALFIDMPATQRLVKQNITYIMHHKELDAKGVWGNQEGIDSIVAALKQSLWYGCMLPDMGSIAPFGSVAVFIPGKETFENVLTGKNGPLEWIEVKVIHENDIRNILKYDNEGNLVWDIDPGFPQGEPVLVAVRCYDKKRKIKRGKVFDAKRLLQKAKEVSSGYKYYLDDIISFNAAKSKGKTYFKNGKEYCKKTIPKKSGGTWEKEISIDDLSTPWEGASQEEMLEKAAIKSYFTKDMRQLNALNMATEWESVLDGDRKAEEILDDCLATASQQVAPVPDLDLEPEPDEIKDAEFENSPVEEPTDLFDESDRV